jgi:hypothetical protein
MNTTIRAVLGAALLASVAAPAVAQNGTVTRDGFSWSEPVAAGAWLRIHNQSGPIEVRESRGSAAEVRAELRSSNGQLPEASFQVVRDGANVTICAMPVGSSTCTTEGIRSRGEGWRRGSVAFTVLLPRGVKIDAVSGSGAISVRNAGEEVVATTGSGSVRVLTAAGQVRARTGSGSVEVSEAGGPVAVTTGSGSINVSTAAGPVNARTGSGSIDIRMLALRASDDMEFTTGSGQITLRLPRDFHGEIDARTGNGRINTDFPLTVQGSMGRGSLRGTIGEGGRRIRLASGSGGIALRLAD